MKKVLIAEDDPSILISLDYLMRKKGYEVFVARDGKEAWDIAQEQTPDAVLLDVMMPHMDGYEVCEHIESTPKTQNAKVVFLTAKAREEDKEKGYAVGASDYITKPFSTTHIAKRVKELLEEN